MLLLENHVLLSSLSLVEDLSLNLRSAMVTYVACIQE